MSSLQVSVMGAILTPVRKPTGSRDAVHCLRRVVCVCISHQQLGLLLSSRLDHIQNYGLQQTGPAASLSASVRLACQFNTLANPLKLWLSWCAVFIVAHAWLLSKIYCNPRTNKLVSQSANTHTHTHPLALAFKWTTNAKIIATTKRCSAGWSTQTTGGALANCRHDWPKKLCNDNNNNKWSQSAQ